MKFSLASTVVVALAAQGVVASSWFGKPVYNKWHETELERWLSDHNVPYPTPYDRKQLEDLVTKNWNDKVVTPYNGWDTQSLQNYLTSKGYQGKKGAENNKNSLIEQVKSYWTDTEESVHQAYGSVQDWIFDSWTDSQLKAFLDRHNIPAPQPRNRDTLLKTARANYQSVAEKLKETSNYPGDWLYETWSDSDLKAWLDERGYPAPQPTSRDKLIASVRRNSRLTSLNLQAAASSASASAASAQQSLSDQLINAWSDSQLKEWADKNGIKVPQGSKRNELVALIRKHRAQLYGDSASATAASAYGAATSKAGNEYAEATNGFAYYTNWVKQLIGFAAESATALPKEAYSSAYNSATSAASVASKSASSASKAGSASAANSYSSAAKSAESAASSAQSALSRASKIAAKATGGAKEGAREEL